MSKKDFSRLKALVVDDDRVLQLIMKKELDAAGIQSVAASNGTEALHALKQVKFDFVLMDISMPEQDGLDTVRWIRDLNDVYKDIPVFAVTSFGTKAHTEEIMQTGFNEHFVKPLDFQKLFDCLGKYF